jgi:hypothetical protein
MHKRQFSRALLCKLQIRLPTVIHGLGTQQRGVRSGSGGCDEQGGEHAVQSSAHPRGHVA